MLAAGYDKGASEAYRSGINQRFKWLRRTWPFGQPHTAAAVDVDPHDPRRRSVSDDGPAWAASSRRWTMAGTSARSLVSTCSSTSRASSRSGSSVMTESWFVDGVDLVDLDDDVAV